MPAYSFQRQFAEPIVAGTKGGTIRATRRVPAKWSQYARDRHPGGHAAPGEPLYLYRGMRTPQCTLIAEKTCLGAASISIHFEPKWRVDLRLDSVRHLCYRTGSGLEAFARFDGFDSFFHLAEFWRDTHGPLRIFDGWHIRWMPLPGEAA